MYTKKLTHTYEHAILSLIRFQKSDIRKVNVVSSSQFFIHWSQFLSEEKSRKKFVFSFLSFVIEV